MQRSVASMDRNHCNPKGPCTQIVNTLAPNVPMCGLLLGSWVVPFCAFCFKVPLLKLNILKKGTLIMKGLLGNLDFNLGYMDP